MVPFFLTRMKKWELIYLYYYYFFF
jgi:hypothetical protein